MKDDEALELGQQNQRAITMLKNHCTNARVSINVSPYGRMVGLPIGPAKIACDHAAFFGMSGIDITYIATEFYEQRCIGCPHRNPTGQVPTIVTEAERRKSELEANEAIERERQLALEAGREQRSSARNVALAGQPYTVRDLATHIERIDRNATSASDQDVADSRRRIVEIARLWPEHFVDVLIDDLERLAIAKDPTSIEALGELASNDRVAATRIADIAADILSNGPHTEAGKIVATFTRAISKEKFSAASLGAIALASDWDAAFPAPREPAAPAAAVALATAAWEDFRATLLQELRHESDWRREAACHAARYIMRECPDHSEELVGPILDSIWRKDRGYAGNPAPGAAAVHAIAEAWSQQPNTCIDSVERRGASGSSEVRDTLMNIPHCLRRIDTLTPEAEVQIIRFLLRRMDEDWGVEAAAEASHELAGFADERPLALAPLISELIGLLIRACQPEARDLIKTIKDPQLEQLEKMSRNQQRRAVRGNLAEALGRVAGTMPGAVFEACSEVLRATTGDAQQDQLTRVTFLKVFETAACPQTVAYILPQLYTALLSDDVALRSAAIYLWKACARAACTLPHDLQDLAERLLTDNYVIVHEAMIDALPGLRIDDKQLLKLLEIVLRWAVTYARAASPEGLEKALDTALWGIDRFPSEWRPSIGLFAIEQSAQLSRTTRENLLLRSVFRPYRQTDAWAKAALEVLASREDFVISPPDNRLLAALVEEPNGLQSASIEMFQAVIEAHGNTSLPQCIEMLELLQSVGRWREAERLAQDLLQSLPETEEYRSRREWLGFIHQAALDERLIAEGGTPDQVTDLNETGNPLRTHVRNRRSARKALQKVPLDDPAATADVLRNAAQALRDFPTERDQIDLYADVVDIAVHLIEYDAAIRQVRDGSQHLAAAQRRAQLLAEHSGSPMSNDGFSQVARKIKEPEIHIDELLTLVAKIPLPLPFCSLPQATRHATRRTTNIADIQQSSPVVVCGLRLNGEPVSTISVIYQDTVPDLDVILRFAEWPSGATECRIEFLSTFPASALSWPSFTLSAKDVTRDARGLTVSRSGHLDVLAKRPPGASPIELDVHVQFIDSAGRGTTATVAGHERLFVRPYDPTRDVLTNRRQMDQRLLEMFADLSLDSSIDQRDKESFCQFFAACVRAAHEIMFDKLTKAGSKVTEKQFHDRFERLLLSDSSLSGRLTRRDPVAGGFDDLMYDDVIAELKVERKRPRKPQECHSYIGQPAQYGVGRGSRLSILVVLDQAHKDLPPAVLDNGVAWMFPRMHGYDDPQYPSRVGVLVIPGSWKVPSSWSRRKVPSAAPST